jgi:hypothetical protein
MTKHAWLPALALTVLCAAPAAAALDCIVCPNPIAGGKYYSYTSDGTTYTAHGSHPKLESCDACGGLLAPRSPWGTGGREADGSFMCTRCRTTAIRTNAQGQAIVDAVRARMESWGMKFRWGKIPVQLVDGGVIQAKLGVLHPGMKAAGLTDTAFKQYTDGRREVTGLKILMRHTTPQAEFERTAAHELTHAWMSLAGAPHEADPAFVEGACNLIAYYYLQTRDTSDANRIKKLMLKSPNPIYGEGFRRQIKYATDHRVRGLLKILPTATGFPAGY